MRVTPRCKKIFRLLVPARWLSTSQVHRWFFGQATADAARKRLRKLTSGGYLVMTQANRMTEALFKLGREGKRILELDGMEVITLEGKPPKQVEHFTGINDLRFAAESCPKLDYFFACWELPAIGWRYQIIPDALFSIGRNTFLVEFDRGHESLPFFIRTKIQTYSRGLAGITFKALLVVSDRPARIRSLMKAISANRLCILFATIAEVRKRGIDAPVFCDRSGRVGTIGDLSSQTVRPIREVR